MIRLVEANAIGRLSAQDPSLFSNDETQFATVAERLGWVNLASEFHEIKDTLQALFEESLNHDIKSVVLLGMGGSSLAAKVLRDTLPSRDVKLYVVDTTSPKNIARLIELLDFKHTLFIVASKSGTTLEPLILSDLFHEYAEEKLGYKPSEHFIAITDEGTPLHQSAIAHNWRHVALARSTVGGRFSALSLYGLVPSALIGIDFERVVESAALMESRCRFEEVATNPAAQLACFLSSAALGGKNQLMLLFSERYKSFGLWLEQLIAESLGKDGQGLVPIITTPERIKPLASQHMCAVALIDSEDEDLSSFAKELSLQIPVKSFELDSPFEVGAEFVRWEFAVALCGFLLELNPFDQPDVASSKNATAEVLVGNMSHAFVKALSELESDIRDEDYIALLAFIDESFEKRAQLDKAALLLEEVYKRPVIIGVGPRYLHSTGQLFKGGPNTCLCLVVGDDHSGGDISLVHEDYTLGDVFRAQMLGDIISLTKKNRRTYVVDSLDVLLAKLAKA